MDIPVLAGWATAEITPDIPCRMGGYGARTGLSASTHDPLYAHVLALGTATRQLVIVVCDLIGVDTALVEKIRQDTARRYPGATVWLSATHTHAGPDTLYPLTETPELSLLTYREHLVSAIDSTIQAALTGMHSVWVRRTGGPINAVATNRDHPARTAEITLDLLCFFDEPAQTQPAALFGSFPCHPTVLSAANLAFSADLPGAFRRQLRALAGNHLWIALATGAAGDISTRHTRQGQGFDELERLGNVFARQASELLAGARPLELTSPEMHTISVNLPSRVPLSFAELTAYTRDIHQRMDVARQQGHLAQVRTLETALQGIQLANLVQSDQARERNVVVEVALLGQLALVAVPGELYSHLGTLLKQTTGHDVLLLGYTNGYVGYLPTREAYEEPDYEVLISPFAPGSAEKLIEALRVLLVSA